MFSYQTYERLIKRILANAKANNLDTREGSVSFNLIAPLVEELAKAYILMGDVLNMAFIEDTFDEYLEKRTHEFGIYRKEGEKSTGVIEVTGQDRAYIENGSIVVSDGLEFVVLNDIMLPYDNVIYVEAMDVGYRYNLPAGSTFTLKEARKGIEMLTNPTEFTNGVDIETDEDLKERFKYIIQNPRTSGNVNNYKEWALECPGVGKVQVFPLWNGNGTVKVNILGDDHKPCSTEIIEKVYNHIEEKRPIGATVTVTTSETLSVDFNILFESEDDYANELVQEQITNSLREYVDSLGEDENIVYVKALSAIGDLDGVKDVIEFTINGERTNIELGEKIAFINSITFAGSEV